MTGTQKEISTSCVKKIWSYKYKITLAKHTLIATLNSDRHNNVLFHEVLYYQLNAVIQFTH